MADIVQPDSHTFMTYPFCQKLLVQHGISGAERVTTGNWLACWLAVVTDRMRKYPTERNFNFAQRMTAADVCVQSTTGIEIKSGRRLVVVKGRWTSQIARPAAVVESLGGKEVDDTRSTHGAPSS